MSRMRAFVALIVQAALDIVAALFGIYYSRKYSAIIRRLGLPRYARASQRGFIVVQIDGLAFAHLQQALHLGYAPHIQRMLRRGEWLCVPWRCGLPSSTPSAQAAIMFGNNDDIPAFRWYEKQRELSLVCSMPSLMRDIQERISAVGRGILQGGSSYMNMFDGDASLSMFTMGAWSRKRFFENVRGLGFLLLFLLNPFRSLKMCVLALWEYLSDLYQRTAAKLANRTPRPMNRGFAFLRIMSNVVLREIQTFAVMVDIYRGVPAIFTTYYGYDELAHNYGPCSRQAWRALRAIDARIRQIDHLRRLALTREYDLYILSDHGMTAAVPFAHRFGEPLGPVIRRSVGDGFQLSEALGGDNLGAFAVRYLAEELGAIEANLAPSLAFIPRKLRQLVRARIVDDEEQSPIDPSRRTDVVIRDSGSLSHVYFNASSRQLDLSEITILYPSLIGDLLSHPGIWLVAGRENERVIVLSQEGVLTIGNALQVEGKNPLARLADASRAARELERLVRFSRSGDLILMGRYDPQTDAVACFEPFWGCHGGLGGAQETPFLLAPPGALAGQVVEQGSDLYKLFSRYQTAPSALDLESEPLSVRENVAC